MSALAALRAATRSSHDAVDAAFGRFDLAHRDDYARFLTAHARALPAVEAALSTASGLPPLRPRAGLLEADLTALGLPTPEPLSLDMPVDHATAFGMAYVIEGSRLGGAVLARQVPPELPRAYLSATHLSGEWRAFGQAIDNAATDEAWTARAIAGARRVFDLYARAAA
jgi:heme oxygenase